VNKIKCLINYLLLGGVFLTFSSNVMALPSVTGSLGMTGGFNPVDDAGSPINAAAATGVDFNFFGVDKFRAVASDGDFSSLNGQLGDITDFQFDSFVTPIASFWSIGQFSFELTSISRDLINDPDLFLVLNGVGVISAAGFEDTAANWSFTGDTSGSGVFSWSASSTVANVPEPGVLVLLSIGLVGLGLRKRLSNRI